MDFDIVWEFNFGASTPVITQLYYKRLSSRVFMLAFLSYTYEIRKNKILAKIKVSNKLYFYSIYYQVVLVEMVLVNELPLQYTSFRQSSWQQIYWRNSSNKVDLYN